MWVFRGMGREVGGKGTRCRLGGAGRVTSDEQRQGDGDG